MTLTTMTIVRPIASMAMGGMVLKNGQAVNAAGGALGCLRRAI
jgi:hypothetical protein